MDYVQNNIQVHTYELIVWINFMSHAVMFKFTSCMIGMYTSIRPMHCIYTVLFFWSHTIDLTRIQEHTYDQVEFFHLTAEDATSVGTHLHSALVSSKQLEIMGDLGEGTIEILSQ